MVVGLDFYTTSPTFLEAFLSIARIGKALQGGTFHPKLYFFTRGERFCCIMGSSNFTRGGFSKNAELNVCVEGKRSNVFARQVESFIDEQEKYSEHLSAPERADYLAQFEKFKNTRVRIAKFHPEPVAKAKAETIRQQEESGDVLPEQLNRTWAEFIKIILATKRRGQVLVGTTKEKGYLQTVARCQALFAKYKTLALMPPADRQFVAGTVKAGGSFGSMRGAGKFNNLLNDDPASLDAALDHIPRSGVVDKQAFDAFAARYRWDRAGVGTGSRLIAMKRPDLFICIDAKNRAGIARAFGFSASSLQSFEGYWELMQRIWRCPWHRAPRPRRARDGRVWDARVALLDSIYYDAAV
jgi:hypothetical protein